MNTTQPTATIRADLLRLADRFAAGKGEIRYYLTGVSIQPCPHGGAYVIGSDGHRVAVFRDADGYCEAPVIVRLDGELRKAAATRRAEQRAGKVRRFTLRAGEPQTCTVTVETEAAPCDAGDWRLLYEAPADLIDGTFPDVFRVIPREIPESSATPAVQAGYLADFAAVIGEADSKYPAMRVIGGADDKSAVLVVSTRTDFVGVVMPIRDAGAGLPAWCDSAAIDAARADVPEPRAATA